MIAWDNAQRILDNLDLPQDSRTQCAVQVRQSTVLLRLRSFRGPCGGRDPDSDSRVAALPRCS